MRRFLRPIYASAGYRSGPRTGFRFPIRAGAFSPACCGSPRRRDSPAPSSVSSYRYARVAIVVQRVFEHTQLQKRGRAYSVRCVSGTAPVKQADFHAIAFHSVPQLAHFRRYGTCGECALHRAVGVRQPEHIVEVDSGRGSGRWGLRFAPRRYAAPRGKYWSYPSRLKPCPCQFALSV